MYQLLDISASTIDWSRGQFALTAIYHWLFVPLTLGLALIMGIVETCYYRTKKRFWKDAAKFWQKLFGVNFAMGVATGIILEFEFGTNWSNYSWFVGDIFGAPLAIEGILAFFLESTFVAVMFFGWKKVSPGFHLASTWLTGLGATLSAWWILVANAWMQYPVGQTFNPDTMRMEVSDFMAVLFNPVAQAKFVHTVSAGYVTGAMFVLSISAFYLLRGRPIELAKRSMTVAASFGLAAALSVVVLGDESGYTAGENQKMKIAAIEAMWDTEPAPASFTLFGLPDLANRRTNYEVKIPWMLGLIATRSIDKTVPGIKELVGHAEQRIRSGLIAYDALEKLRKQPSDAERARLDATAADLGYALLLKRIRPDIGNATADEIAAAAWSTVPAVSPLFWSFRIMVGLGFYFIALFALAFMLASLRQLERYRSFLWLALISLPLPWVAAELGWIVAEVGRQPWVIEGVLPTFLAVSSISAADVWTTLIGFVVFYSTLAVVDVYLMVKTVKDGPPSGAPSEQPALRLAASPAE